MPLETDRDTSQSEATIEDLPSDDAGQNPAGPKATIGGRITTRAILLVSIPLVFLGIITVLSFFVLSSRAERRLEQSRDVLITESIGTGLQEASQLLLDRMDAVVTERMNDVIDWTRAAPVVVAAGADRPELEPIIPLSVDEVEEQFEGTDLLDESGVSSAYLNDQIVDRAEFAEVFFTDASGFNVGATNPTSDFVQRDEEWWQTAWNERAFLGPVELDQSAGVVSLEIAVRIDDAVTLEPLGVMKAVVDVSLLQSFADEFAASGGEDLEVIVVDSSDVLIAETATNHNANRIANAEVALTGDAAVGLAGADDDVAPSGFSVLDQTIVGYAKAGATRFVDRLRVDVANHGWVVLTTQPLETALRPLRGLEAVRSDLANSARNLTGLVVLVVGLAVAIAYGVSRVVAGRIADPINRLRDEAHRIADEELPALVDALRDPESAEHVAEVAPIDIESDGEVAELAEAFNSVRSTAVRLAAEQAIARRQVTNMLRNLGRRNQQLIGRQLEFIDRLEQHESDPDVLDNLFRLDSLATRMRRNAESLVVLAGDTGLRSGGEPMAIEDIVRGAISEVEDYERVQITAAEPVMIQGAVVNDLTHLLAEIIENATNFSPPGTPVAVIGSRGLDGSYSISVVDQGLGMSRAKMAEANARIRRPNITDDPQSSYLGLYVIGRLASRHQIDARLVESATEGVTAKLTLRDSCIVEEISDEVPAGNAPASTVASEPSPREVDVATLTPSVRKRPVVEAAHAAPATNVAAPEPEPQPAWSARASTRNESASTSGGGESIWRPVGPQDASNLRPETGDPDKAPSLSERIRAAQEPTTEAGVSSPGESDVATVDSEPAENTRDAGATDDAAAAAPDDRSADQPDQEPETDHAVVVADVAGDVDAMPPADGTIDVREPSPVDTAQAGALQVRQRASRRVRSEDPAEVMSSEPVMTPGGRARAEAVRDRLTRYAEGVTIGRATSLADPSDDAVRRAGEVSDRMAAFADGSTKGRMESKARAAEASAGGVDPDASTGTPDTGPTNEKGE